MVADRRAQLIDAGVDLILSQRFQDLLSGVDTRSITERGGVTTGSFFHHFRNRAQFAEAVVERFSAIWEAGTRQLADDLDGVAESGGAEGVRSTGDADWNALVAGERSASLQHLLWVARDQPLIDGGQATGGEVLGEAYRSLTDQVLPGYQRALDAIGREMLPPFDPVDLAVALTAIADGLQMRHAVDPACVRDALYVDLVSAVVIALTRPAGERFDPPDLPALERQLVNLPVEVGAAGSERTTWRHIAEAAAPLFVDRAVADVRVAEIAEAAGVSASTVYHQFGSVSAVAAASWVRHLPELEAIAVVPLTPTEGPVVRMEQVLTRYIQIARTSRGALEGLVLEAVASAADDPGPAAAMVWTLLVPHIRELRARGLLRRRIDSATLARSIMQLVAMRLLTVPDEPPERVIDDTLGTLLEGSLLGDVR